MIVSGLAHAKINISLEVTGRRSDGYHDLATVMQQLQMADEITLYIGTTLEQPPGLLTDESDLILQAVSAYRMETGIIESVQAVVQKHIPVAAGLGGGSSDAAATLLLMNRAFNNRLPPDRLLAIGASLGSDVPFFLTSTAAHVSGRGEHIVPIHPLQDLSIVLVTPAIQIENKTKAMYAKLNPTDFSQGNSAAAVSLSMNHGIVPASGLLTNAFWRPLQEAAPEIDELAVSLRTAGAPFIALSGAGPTIYTWFSSLEDAKAFKDRLEANVRCTTSIALTRPHIASTPGTLASFQGTM